MQLLTKKIKKDIPELYSQDGKGDEAIVHAKFFLFHFTWYATEFDEKTGTFFGLVCSNLCPEGELGYFTLEELESVRGPFNTRVERDIYFSQKKLGEIRKGLIW